MQAPTNVVHAGLGLTEDQTMDLLCQAFRQAVDDYCSAPKGKRGGFNNFFFNSLRNLPPPNTQMGKALAGEIVREAPIFVGAVQGTAQAVAAAPTIAGNVGPVAQALAGAYQQAAFRLTGGMGAVTGMVAGPVRNSLGIGAMFEKGFARWSVLAQNGVRLRFPDGLIGNRVVEIKGPADYYRNPAQQADYQAFCAPDAPMEPDCSSCNATNCVNGKLPRGDDGCR
ncbi:hypothetical protein WMF38_07615 [Sorangium sp. So ce118]